MPAQHDLEATERSKSDWMVAFLESALQYAVTFALPAIVFLPWVTEVVTAWAALGLAWLGATVLLLKHLPGKPAALCSIVAAGIATLLAFQVKPTPSLTGRIEAPIEKDGIPGFEIGDSGTVINFHKRSGTLVDFFKKNKMVVELIDGRTALSTIVRDDLGTPIAEIVKNEWKIAGDGGSWDRNYSDDALEIKDRNGNVIFQMLATDGGMQLQGEWRAAPENYVVEENGNVVKAVRLVTGPIGGRIIFNPDSSSTEIEPMFNYPGDLHLGERIDQD